MDCRSGFPRRRGCPLGALSGIAGKRLSFRSRRSPRSTAIIFQDDGASYGSPCAARPGLRAGAVPNWPRRWVGEARVMGPGAGMLMQTELVWLLGAVARGDETAFERLYEATRAKLYGVLLRILGKPALA